MAKPLVITIHGVNPNRGWQPAVHEVLKPHFDCLSFEYHDYDTIIGPVRAVFNVHLRVLSTIAFVFAFGAVILGYRWGAAFAALVFGAVFLLGLVLGWLRRVACSERLMRYIADRVQSGSPNVIAHSLGTYLVGCVIKKYVSVTFANVLLVSSVLPCDFPWAQILRNRPRSLRRVRNEFGTSDWVVKFVGRIRWLARDLGPSGIGGFREVRELIHTSHSPLVRCPKCVTHPARVHNVPLERYGHSDAFLGRRHARELWLPFLWGFSADELNQYLEDLSTAAEAISNKRWNEAERAIDRLYSTSFTWTHGMTLRNAVKDLVQSRIRLGLTLPDGLSLEKIVEEVRLVLPGFTADAMAESIRPGPDKNVAEALHPNIAIAKAVEHVINAHDANQT